MIDLDTAKPREVEAYLRESVRKLFGDETENASSITSSHGYYSIEIVRSNKETISFKNFRKGNAKKIVKALRALV